MRGLLFHGSRAILSGSRPALLVLAYLVVALAIVGLGVANAHAGCAGQCGNGGGAVLAAPVYAAPFVAAAPVAVAAPAYAVVPQAVAVPSYNAYAAVPQLFQQQAAVAYGVAAAPARQKIVVRQRAAVVQTPVVVQQAPVVVRQRPIRSRSVTKTVVR